MSTANQKRRPGRPGTSKNFKLVPVRYAKPDALKLGRAFLALAVHHGPTNFDTDVPETEDDRGSA
jgi:hypothetical protein